MNINEIANEGQEAPQILDTFDLGGDGSADDVSGYDIGPVDDLEGDTNEDAGEGDDDEEGEDRAEEGGEEDEEESPAEESEDDEDKEEDDDSIEVKGISIAKSDLEMIVDSYANISRIDNDLKAGGYTLADALEAGQVYIGVLDRFESGPEGAREVIEALVTEAVAKHGANFEAPQSLEGLDLDPDTATTNEKALIGLMKSMKENHARELKSLKDGLAEVSSSYRKTSEATKLASAVKVATGYDVTPETILQYVEETGLDDPVKAFKVATYGANLGKAEEPKRSVDAGKRKAPRELPRGSGSEQTFDPQAKGMTVEMIESLMRKGLKPRVEA